MIRCLLLSFLASSLVVFTAMTIMYFSPLLTVESWPHITNTAGNLKPLLMSNINGRICYLYMYEAHMPTTQPPSTDTLERLIKQKISNINLSIVVETTGKYLDLQGNVEARVYFIVDKITAFEIERRARDRQRYALTPYLPLIDSNEFLDFERYVESVAKDKLHCNSSVQYWRFIAPNQAGVACGLSSSILKATHLAIVCISGDSRIPDQFGNLLSMNSLLDEVLKSPQTGSQNSTISYYASILYFELSAEYIYSLVSFVEVEWIHLARSAGLLLSSIGLLMLYYRLHPEESRGFKRFSRRIRRLIYRQ